MVCKPESDSIYPKTLKQVIRTVAEEEDRRHNVIIFNVQEQEQGNWRECVKVLDQDEI